MDEKHLYDKLSLLGQEHVWRFHDHLSKEEKLELLHDIKKLDMSLVTKNANSKTASAEQYEPVRVVTQQQSLTLESLGQAAVVAGKVAVLVLSGGQGTRLNYDHPKGMFNLGVNKPFYLFEALLHNLMQLAARLDTQPIELYLMTSEDNHEETVSFLQAHAYFGYDAEHIHFFIQDMAPVVDDASRVLLSQKHRISFAPNGNGGWYTAMKRLGYLDSLKNMGAEWINVVSLDNPLQRMADPAFVGAVLARGSSIGAKVVRKRTPEERVGVLLRMDGRPCIIELL